MERTVGLTAAEIKKKAEANSVKLDERLMAEKEKDSGKEKEKK